MYRIKKHRIVQWFQNPKKCTIKCYHKKFEITFYVALFLKFCSGSSSILWKKFKVLEQYSKLLLPPWFGLGGGGERDRGHLCAEMLERKGRGVTTLLLKKPWTMSNFSQIICCPFCVYLYKVYSSVVLCVPTLIYCTYLVVHIFRQQRHILCTF